MNSIGGRKQSNLLQRLVCFAGAGGVSLIDGIGLFSLFGGAMGGARPFNPPKRKAIPSTNLPSMPQGPSSLLCFHQLAH